MADQMRPVVVVHGVGAGENEDRAGFSSVLAGHVATRSRRVTPVGLLPGGVNRPRDGEVRGIRWEEALWESENHAEDAAIRSALTAMGVLPPVLNKITGPFLDLLSDVPLYLSVSGTPIRRRVRSVIAANPGCVVVGHSLGSVIATDVLSRSFSASGKPLDVAALVTLGSPLNLLGLRTKLVNPFPFRWENYRYEDDPICFGGDLDTGVFPEVKNFELARDAGFGVAHTHYWSSRVVADTVRRMSRHGE